MPLWKDDDDTSEIVVKVILIGCAAVFLVRIIFSFGAIDMPVIGGISTAFTVPVGVGAAIMFVAYLRKKARQ